MRRHISIAVLCLSAVLGLSMQAHGQALPSAARPVEVQAGVGFSFARPDFVSPYNPGFPYIKGFTVYADATYHHRFGFEAEVHDDSILTPADIGENTYMIGPKVSVIHQDRMNLYAKGLGGLGAFEYQKNTYPNPHTDTYGIFAVGGGIEFRASRHINVRAIDIEQQWWRGFAPRGIAPFVATLGVAYSD